MQTQVNRRPVSSINAFSVSGLSVGSSIEAVHSKLGQPLAVHIEHGVEFLYYHEPNLLPLKYKPGNAFVGLDAKKTVVWIRGSSLLVEDRRLNNHSNYSEVTALLSTVGAPRPLEDAIESKVYSLHYSLPDGKIHISFDPGAHGTSYSLERETGKPNQIPLDDGCSPRTRPLGK